MDTAFSVDELRDAARLVRDCPAMGQALALARWICVAFRGDSPVEYWSEDDPAEPEPFDLADVNRKLAALAQRGSPS